MNIKMGVVGLGYVGLPLAVEFGKLEEVVGFDINEERIGELRKGIDSTGEVSPEDLGKAKINYTDDPQEIKKANFIIVAVPTPIDEHKNPDLGALLSASRTVGENLNRGSLVVYESTVWPGCTEEVCVPIIEEYSGLKCGPDWKIGYSPERINPGDQEHTIDKVVKVVSGMDQESREKIFSVYARVCRAGIHQAPSIKVAEAAKVIENVQRDLNIALINELAILFDRLGIDTGAVLAAAGTKWNFHQYHPGLVGGHCIGIDPYYLTHKAEELGYYPEIILAGRRINDNMHRFYAEKAVRKLIREDRKIQGAKVLVMGLTFKPNVSDYRNSRVKELVQELKGYGIEVYGYDPLVGDGALKTIFGEEIFKGDFNDFDLIILAQRHRLFEDDLKKIDPKKLLEIK